MLSNTDEANLKEAINNRKPYYGQLQIEKSLYPTWDSLVPYFDRSFLNGNIRARNPHKLFVNVHDNHFSIVKTIKDHLRNIVQDTTEFSCHCYAGFSPNAFASPPHSDAMEVFFVMIQGSMPWKIFENGCDYNNETETMTSKSTFSRQLVQGDFVYVPKGIYHVALPNQSRAGFSFGWY